MSPADLPPAGNVILIVAAGHQLAQPLPECAFETFNLSRSASDDLTGIGMAADFVVEIIYQIYQMGCKQLGRRRHTLRVLSRPPYPDLQLLITTINVFDVHDG